MTLRWSSWRNYSYAPWGSRSTPLIFSCGKIKCALRIKYCQLFYPFSISSQSIYLGSPQGIIFFKFLEDIGPFCGATDTPVLDFWWRLLWVSKPEWAALFTHGRGVMWYTFPEIHLWHNTYRPLEDRHGSWASLFHIPSSRNWWGLNGSPIIQQFYWLSYALSLWN